MHTFHVVFTALSIWLFTPSVLGAGCDDVEMVSRDEWEARPNMNVTHIHVPVNMTLVHHTATRHCYDKETCIELMQAIQNYHMDDRGWPDIGYHFLIGEDGRVYEGRGWDVEGSTTGYTMVALAFSVMGNFMEFLPEQIALDALVNIIDCGIELGYILGSHEMFGHKDAGCTLCPGDYLYAEIRTWPSYSFREIPKYC